MTKKPKKSVVYVYGFDRLGFQLPSADHEMGACTIRFLTFNSERSLEEADGLIIPSGIFEELYRGESFYGCHETRIRYDKSNLAQREKQLLNSYKAGAWIVFLLQAVDTGPDNTWTETDLAKKILHVFATRVISHDPNPYAACKTDEFRKYFDCFGIAQTTFLLKDDKSSARILATNNDQPVALEVHGSFFFLPFFSTKRERAVLVSAVSELVDAVSEYKRKNDFYLPAWLSGVQFVAETRIAAEIQQMEERLLALNEEQKQWQRYKGILCTSGTNLNEIVVEVLRDYFGLNLKSEEKFVEDAVIYDAAGGPLFVVEIKGVNGGLKREHVNQVDSHRERLGIDSTFSGLLIVNDFMDLEDIDQRKAKAFDAQHLTHAHNNNIKILRTTALFELMVLTENLPTRGDEFLRLCTAAAPLVTIAST